MSREQPRGIGRELLAAARSLHVDQVTAAVVGRAHQVGVRPILLKGPTIAGWLYADGTPRTYVDTDLLVAPGELPALERVLRAEGFRRRQPGWQEHSWSWVRSEDGSMVDVHTSLFGVAAPDEQVWRALSARTQPISVAGLELDGLQPPALVLHVALHAIQHGSEGGHPPKDLARALDLAGEQTWREAAALAEELGAGASMAAGLSLHPRGRELAELLGLPSERSTALLLHAEGGPDLVLGLEHLATAASWGARFRFLVRRIAPKPSYMLRWSPLARRGRLGLILSYLWRPFWMIGRIPAALRAWRRVRRGESRQLER